MLMKENVQTWKNHSGLRDELMSSMIKNFPKIEEPVSLDVAKQLASKPETLKRKFREIFFSKTGGGLTKKIQGKYPEFLLEFHDGWVEFYKTFGLTIDLADYQLPDNLNLAEGKNYWSIVVPPGFNPQKAFDIRKQLTKTYEWVSVSKMVDIYPRVPASVIAANQNAISEYSNMSCAVSMEQSIWGTTLTEGLLIDGRVFKDSGVHLDVQGWTLHTGSRSLGGGVPYSCWNPGNVRLKVGDDGLDYAFPGLSLRQKQF
jgi:hypothetical protein